MKTILLILLCVCLVIGLPLAWATYSKHQNTYTQEQLVARYGQLVNYQPRTSFVYLINPSTKVVLCLIYDNKANTYQLLSAEKAK